MSKTKDVYAPTISPVRIALEIVFYIAAMTAVAAIVAATCSASDSPACSPPYAVKVQNQRKDQLSFGSGTVIQNGRQFYVLTNRHVVVGNDATLTILAGNIAYNAKLFAVDTEDDLALLAIEGVKDGQLVGAKIAKDVPGKGASLTMNGYPLGGNQVRKKGPVIGWLSSHILKQDRTVGEEVFFVGVKPTVGESGSAFFNENGEVVAVLWGGVDRSHCASLSSVKRFLKKVFNESR